MNHRQLGRALSVIALVVSIPAIVACSPLSAAKSSVDWMRGALEDSPVGDVDESYGSDFDDWVIVHFADNDDYSSKDAFDQLFDTETVADEALWEHEAGLIDGNEFGTGSYDIYFVGEDRATMWEVLEPVFDDAPLAWTSVELFDGLEDPAPTLISPEL